MAYCSHLLSPSLLLPRLEYTSEAHRRRCVTKTVDLNQVRAMPGSMDIGRPTGITIGGWRVAGIVRRTKAHIGTILTMTTSSKAGNCTKATGITRITTEIAEIMARGTNTITS